MTQVSLHFDADIAVITIDNPPVNAASHAVRQGIVESLNEVASSSARAVVLMCAGRTFVAGADIREFNKPPEEPHLPDVVTTLEDFSLPIIAAIHGTALGGGLELALGCHYRIAVESARVGLPEVNLGVIPGAGGTQRLPRLVGLKKAAEMITQAQMLGADAGKANGLIDEVVAEPLRDAAILYARKIADSAWRKTRELELSNGGADDAWFEQFEQKLSKKYRGQRSPVVALEAVRTAQSHDFDQAMQRERELFLQCKESEQSGALRHIFFAERATGKSIKSLQADAKKIDSVAVIGAGTMGAGIALNCANAGIPVTLVELAQENLDRGIGSIEKSLDKALSLGILDESTRAKRRDLISGTTSYADIASVDLVIEAAFESMPVKTEIFQQLDAMCSGDTLFATNTSYLDVNEIAATVSHPERVVGLHFFSPADRMKLLELVTTEVNTPEVLQTAWKFSKRLGKIPVPVGVCYGFAANRSYAAYQRAAQELLLEGVNPAALDRALTDWGMAMGPCAVLDLSGIDIGYHARKAHPNPPDDPRWFAAANALAEQELFGRKSGAGFYLYGDNGSGENPQALKIIGKVAKSLGVSAKASGADQIVERVIGALVEEGKQIIDEGIVDQASDLDVIWVNGYGFPRWRGGPMHYKGVQ